MSRFYAGVSSSDSEDSSSSDNEQFMPPSNRGQRPAMFLPSDDEEEVRHVVKSAKDKCWEQLQNIIKLMQNAIKIGDLSKLIDHFDNLVKTHVKHKNVIKDEGTPRFYIKCLLETDEYVKTLWDDKDKKKKLSKSNSKSLNTLKRKLKKYLEDFEQEVKNFKENPEESEVEDNDDDEDEDGSSDDDFKKDVATPAPATEVDFLADEAPKAVDFLKDDNDDDDSSYWGSSSSDDSDDSGDEADRPKVMTADYFLKSKSGDKDGGDKEKKRKPRAEKDGKKKKEEKWEEVKAGGKPSKSMFEKGVEVTHSVAIKKLNEIILNRGRRSTLRHEQVDLLKELRDICEQNELGHAIHIRITLDMVQSYFDYNSKMLDCMNPEPWNEVLQLVEKTLEMLNTHSDIRVDMMKSREDDNVCDQQSGLRIHGNPVMMVDTLHREFVKIMQNADAHSPEYMTHLRQESRIIKIIYQLKDYVESVDKDTQNICQTYLLLISYIYYKYDKKTAARQEGWVVEDGTEDEIDGNEKDSTQLIETLCSYIYTNDTQARLRTHAILYNIYHHSIHDRYYKARDLMLMSHLQESISFSDPVTQIIYNRTMVQLGICAFRKGLMRDAHQALVDIQSTGRAKELLAQGLLLQRGGERISPEQEKKEKQRQMPFHQHINLELLECVYLVSAMLLEIPYISSHEFDARRRMISKQYHHQLRVSERQCLLGPPDNMREHIVAASKKLKMGDYKSCFKLVVNDKMKNKVWNLFHKDEDVIEMLNQKVKETALCCYLHTYSHIYDNMSLEWLSSRFEMDKDTCHRVISKLIINEEVAASWDEPSSSLVLHKTEPTRLQNMVNQLSEKLQTMVDVNERILDARSHHPGYRGGVGNQGDNRHNYHRNQENRGYRNEGGSYHQKRGGGGHIGGYQGGRSAYHGRQNGASGGNNFGRNRTNYRGDGLRSNRGGGYNNYRR